MSPSSDTPVPVPTSLKALGDVGPSPVFGGPAPSKGKGTKSQVASFLGGAALPQGPQGGKTLTGQ